MQFIGHAEQSFVEPVVAAFQRATAAGERIHLCFEVLRTDRLRALG